MSGRLLLHQLLAVQLALVLLLAAAVSADTIIVLEQGDRVVYNDTAAVDFLNVYPAVTVPNGTNPAIIVTLTPIGTRTGDVDLFCNPGSDPVVFQGGQAEFGSVAISVNQDEVIIPPAAQPSEGPPTYICGVLNRGTDGEPVQFSLEFTTQWNYTGLAEEERAAAEELYQRCCQAAASCLPWKAASQAAGTPLDLDLCRFGTCDEGGALTSLDARGWQMVCPFPGDLFVQFPGLQRLYISANNFTGDINDAASMLAALPDLQEWAASASNLTGTLDEGTPLCNLTQGVLEAVLIDANGINGSLPACLFDSNSTLFQFSAAANNLAGSIPDAFGGAARLQSFAAGGNLLTGTVPSSLAAAPGLVQVDMSFNYLSGPLPAFTSSSLASLDLKFNQLTGAVPDAYADHPSLNTLDLKGNLLTALPQKWSQPPSAGESSPLNYFRISYNRLQGGFPTALAAYPDLLILSLNNNQLSGPLPDPQAGQFPSLRALNVAENNFSGTLGEGWEGTGIFQLEPVSPSPTTWNVMNLSTNQLTGAVPAFFTNGDYLVNVYVDGNNFSQGGDSPLPQGPAPNSPLSSAAGPAETSSGGGLSGGAIAGVVVGVLIAVGVACIAAFALVRRSRRRNFTAAGGNSSKFARFDDEVSALPAEQTVFVAADAQHTAAPRPQVELSNGATAHGAALPDGPRGW